MVNVQVRNLGDALWRPMTLPTSVQAAQTIAAAARTLKLADQVQIAPSGPGPRALDLRV